MTETKHLIEVTEQQARGLEEAGLIHLSRGHVEEFLYRAGPSNRWREEHQPRTAHTMVLPEPDMTLLVNLDDRNDMPAHGERINVRWSGKSDSSKVWKGQVTARYPEAGQVMVKIKGEVQ